MLSSERASRCVEALISRRAEAIFDACRVLGWRLLFGIGRTFWKLRARDNTTLIDTSYRNGGQLAKHRYTSRPFHQFRHIE